jgi:hypothetical protein
MHLCFALHEGQAENHLYVFPYDLNTHLTFIVLLFMIFCLCFLSCYNMVAKFLLSRLYLSCPCFKFFDLSHNAYIYDQGCVGACHLKNYLFCYHLPTRGRAGVKLGDADTSQTYLNFLMLHACFYTICLVFRYTLWHFNAISRTNLLTRCHSASFLFSAVFVFQKSYTGNILRIGRNKFQKSYFSQKLPENQRGVGVGPRGALTPGQRDPGPGRAA